MSAAAASSRSNGAGPDPVMLETIAGLRAQLWDEGFRPVPVYSYDHPDPDRAGKAPLGNGWEERARRNPPEAATLPAVAHAPNTGLMADGLRAVDIDIDDFELAGHIRALALKMLGDTIIRCRSNSGRCLLPYRAAEGEPPKRALSGKLGKVEVLGRGQQFVSHGRHKTGAELYWSPEPPEEFGRGALPAITERQITEFLAAVAPLIEADPVKAEDPTHTRNRDQRAYDGDGRAETLDVIAALAAIPNEGPPDWEHWNAIGMAAWAASGGSHHAFAAWCAWSAQHPTHDDAACQARWDHYATSPPTQTGAGKLYALAHDAIPGWRRPSETRERANRQGPAEPPPWTDAPEREEAPPRSDEDALLIDADTWDPAQTPRRPWVAPGYALRGAVTLVAGPPSALKSSLMLGWATAIALCWKFGRFHPAEPGKVIVYNVEDDGPEQRRRLEATLRHFDASPADIAGKVIRIAPRTVGTLIVRDENGRLHFTPAMEQLDKLIAKHRPAMFIADPFTELHTAEENDNTAIRSIVAKFRELAITYNMAVIILHHTRKGAAYSPGDPDIARGASAIIGAVRIAVTLTLMSEDDARAFGLPTDIEQRSNFVRLDDAKSNYAPLRSAQWFEKVPYTLANGEVVPAAVPWTPP